MRKVLRYFLLSALVASFGQIYFLPLSGNLRFSTGIIALNLILKIAEDIDELILCFTCGITIFLFRALGPLFFMKLGFGQIIETNIPAMAYYFSFGIIIKTLFQNKRKKNAYNSFIIFAIADSISNIIEAIIRNSLNNNAAKFIILVAFIRSFIAYCIYVFYNKEKLFIEDKEHQIRYTELNLLISNIQAEMFYLRKSMKDIENVMSKSHNLYEIYKHDEGLKKKTLDIAREVHEIKKDYHRVLNGLEAFVSNLEKDEGMTIRSIGLIIKDNTSRTLKNISKAVKITFNSQSDFLVKPIYKLFTILNNLIVNSIEACNDGGEIRVSVEESEEKIVLRVEDTGEGISEEEIPYIFNPGFTTKFDDFTGKCNTGIGLCHVKNIVEDLGGTIELKSELNYGTTFTVILPKKMLNGG
jgi:two-component system, sensor histidine kinase YcbA